MAKYMYVEMIDNWQCFAGAEFGAKEVPTSRVVKLKLTDEQEINLKPLQVGTNMGKPIYESIRFICFQEG